MFFGVFMLVMLLVGQTMAFIDYDFTVGLGLQEHRDAVTDIGVAMNKGFGFGDTIIYIPLLVVGLWGLVMRRAWGVFSMMAAMGVTAYWPIVCLSFLYFAKGTPGFHFTAYGAYTVLLMAIALIGITGMWYLSSRREGLIR
jgi:hypothetical protein